MKKLMLLLLSGVSIALSASTYDELMPIANKVFSSLASDAKLFELSSELGVVCAQVFNELATSQERDAAKFGIRYMLEMRVMEKYGDVCSALYSFAIRKFLVGMLENLDGNAGTIVDVQHASQLLNTCMGKIALKPEVKEKVEPSCNEIGKEVARLIKDNCTPSEIAVVKKALVNDLDYQTHPFFWLAKEACLDELK